MQEKYAYKPSDMTIDETLIRINKKIQEKTNKI